MKPASNNLPSTLQVTGQTIDISALTQRQVDFYESLFNQIVLAYTKARQPRWVVAVAGPPGAGKSVMAALFLHFASQSELPFSFVMAGIDAFHYPNSFLRSKTVAHGKSLKDFKGRYDTYDVTKLSSVLSDFCERKAIKLPEYSRKIHDPIQDVVSVNAPNALLLVEGQWLLYNDYGWERIKKFFGLSLFIDADKQGTRSRVIERHERGGRSADSAAQYYDSVDSQNYSLVQKTKQSADLIIPAYYQL